jgi:eukaryotic-like serine/threonine-protein kinase
MEIAQAIELLEGRYRVEGPLGEGGMGMVVRARHVELDQPVAIKLMRSDLSAVWAERFLREARAASRIESEHVARVFDMSRLEDGTPYMVMELLEGRDLGALLDESGPLPIDEAVVLVRQVCRALAAAHALGIVHRDVKPENLFRTERADGTACIKLLDFGVSKDGTRGADKRLTRTQSVLGSPQFMSPEQLASPRDVDHRTDLWSLGATLFELLTGEHAFPAETVAELHTKILRDPPRRLTELRPEAPSGLEDVITRCLAKRPEDRFESAEALEAALAAIDEPEAIATRDTLPAPFRASLALEQTTEAGLDDETPAATIRPVVQERTVEPTVEGPRRWGIPLGAILGLSGVLFGVAAAQPASPSTAEVLPLPAIVVPTPEPTIEASETASPAPSADSEEASRFMDSVPLPEEVRRDLDQRLVGASKKLTEGELDEAAKRAQSVLDLLASRGIRPREAVSSMGAQATLVLGEVEAARLRTILEAPMATRLDGEDRLGKIDRQMGLVRTAHGRVQLWNVQSFHRCALVKTARAALAVGERLSAAAHEGSGDRTWFVKTAAERLRSARLEFRRALGLRTETTLCMDEARAGHRAADRALGALPKQ